VYFPTIVPTNVSFLIQGPYRTTPSRDNIVSDDSWNRSLVDTTAGLLLTALQGLRELGLLGPGALETLPIDRESFGDRHMFRPLYEATMTALQEYRFLPTHDNDFVAADYAKLARGGGLRELLDPPQLSILFANGEATKCTKWLNDGITLDKTPGLYKYLEHELYIKEVRPEDVVRRLDVGFLKAQTVSWISELYVFLAGQPALLSKGLLDDVDLVRLEDGSHVPVRNEAGGPCAFLPGRAKTGFPIVCSAVCEEKKAWEFLKRLGLSEPDIVDDVIANVLPRYESGSGLPETDYASDIERILTAFKTDSSEKKERLKVALSNTPFVDTFDASSEQSIFARPGEVYIATDKLCELFKGVEEVLLVSNNPALRTEASRNMLEAAGAARYLERLECDGPFSDGELRKMRHESSGYEGITGSGKIKDYTLRGLNALLELLLVLDIDEARKKSALLWEALSDFQKNSADSAFQGTYQWFFHIERDCSFDASFLECLRTSSWIVDREGALRSPAEITLGELGWVENRTLAERLGFKPDDLDRLAENAGLEPQLLSLLKKHGLETAQQLQDILDRAGETDSNIVDNEDEHDCSGIEDGSSDEMEDAGAVSGRGGQSNESITTGTRQRKPPVHTCK